MISGLLFLGGQSKSIAQDDRPVKKEEVTGPNIPADEENHDTKDLEKLLKRYNTDSKKVLEDNSKLSGDEETITEVEEAELEQAVAPKKLVTKPAPKSVESTDISQSVAMALAPMQKLSEKELLKLLDESTKDSAVRPYMDRTPNFTVFVIRLIKDKDSIPSLVKIAANRDRLIRFSGFMIATFIFGFILKRVMHREGRSFIKAAFYFLLRSLIMFSLRIYIVYYFFAPELTPAAKIFKQTFID